MTIKAKPFTPEVLITAPRRSAEAPTDDASNVLFQESWYSFDEGKTFSELRLARLQGETRVLDSTGRASNAVWLNPSLKGERRRAVLLLKEREQPKGAVDLLCYENPFDERVVEPYVVATFAGPVANLKVTKLGDQYYGIAVIGKANRNGTLYNPNTAAKPKSTAKLYNSLFVRHWDQYVTPQRDSIFFAALLPRDTSNPNSYLFMTTLQNALKGTGLESPIPTFGGDDHFDISPTGITFVAKDPDLSPALHTKCNIYLIPLANFLETTPTIYTVDMGDFLGAMTSPRFNSDGSKVVFLAMRKDGYEADRNEIFVMEDTTRPAWISRYRASERAKEEWDRSPDSICFDTGGQKFWVTAEEAGSKSLFYLPVNTEDTSRPHSPTLMGSVSSIVPLPDGNAFVTGSNLVDDSFWKRLSITKGEIFDLSSHSEHGRLLSLSISQCASVTISSRSSVVGKVQYWEFRPSHFDPEKQYPLALLIHGGPQGSWSNSWSTRWNPAVFAEQGYVVVCPNITGSTGFGQAFTDSIQGSWGGRPYQDLEAVLDHLGHSIRYIDTDRAVALGASYGGFMANWIQGQPLGRRFKALVTHDGVFSTTNEIATDEVYFTNHEFCGPFDPSSPSSLKSWREYSPALHIDKWATPHLIIHSEKDYRLTIADGMAAFNALQQKGVESEFLTFPDENHFVQ
ncbi:MAG: hypothetical protein Q9162_003563, partial [Coniocarpon cinnabarinum]